jgi:hypothetical protein
MQLIFTTTTTSRTSQLARNANSSPTQPLPVIWTSLQQLSLKTETDSATEPARTILRAPLRATSAVFLVVLTLATAFATPDIRDLMRDLLRSRAVGRAATPPAPAPFPRFARPPRPAQLLGRFARVPAVHNFTSVDAAHKLLDRGFEPQIDSERDSTVSLGRVTRTDPPAGTKLRRGEPVTFYVSDRPK